MESSSSAAFRPVSEGLIRRVQTARRARATFFSEDLFADPAWEVLLELYAAELAQRRVSISKVSAAAGVPGTTALRWIQRLEQEKFVQRESDPLAARRAWIALTPSGSSSMHSYFEAISKASLPI
jgi:DNA-binding MarR family transcriptional regulator